MERSETRARQRQEPGDVDTRAFPRKRRQRDRRDGSGKIQRMKEKRRERERGVEREAWIGGDKRGSGTGDDRGQWEGGGGKQRALRVDPRAESSIKLNNISVRSLAKKRTAAHGRPTAAGQGWLASQPFPTSVWPQTNFKRV